MATEETDAPINANAVNPVRMIIRVRKPNQAFIHFYINNDTELEKLMRAYCERCDTQETNVIFRYHGRLVSQTDTALTLGLENNDELEAHHSI